MVKYPWVGLHRILVIKRGDHRPPPLRLPPPLLLLLVLELLETELPELLVELLLDMVGVLLVFEDLL